MKKHELYEVETRQDFDKEFARFVKRKKFKTLPKQIEELIEKCERGEFEGDKLIRNNFPVPHDVYKLRLPNPDTNVGKSNGYRVIYMAVTEKKIVVLLTIYYKKEQPTISDSYINALIDGYFISLAIEDKE